MEHDEFLKLHAAYLKTPGWQLRRVAVLDRDKHRCQARLETVCSGVATEVHHHTYRHWRNEPLYDLVSLCSPCHVQITRMDRGELDAIVSNQEAQRLEQRRGLMAFYKAQLAKTPESKFLHVWIAEIERELAPSAEAQAAKGKGN